MIARSITLLSVLCMFLLAPKVAISAEDYLLDTFEGNIEEKDITLQLVNGGSEIELRTWNVFCVYFPWSEQYAIEAHMEDTPHEFTSMHLSGTYGATNMTYALHPGFPDWWWTNPNIAIDGIPSFPQHYTISMTTTSGQTGSVSKSIYTYQIAEESLASNNIFAEEISSYSGSFRVKEHDFGQLVMLDSINIEGNFETSHAVEITLYGKQNEQDDWSLVGTYIFSSDIQEIFFEKGIYVSKVKYGLTGTEGVKLIAEKTNDAPKLISITLTLNVALPDLIGQFGSTGHKYPPDPGANHQAEVELFITNIGEEPTEPKQVIDMEFFLRPIDSLEDDILVSTLQNVSIGKLDTGRSKRMTLSVPLYIPSDTSGTFILVVYIDSSDKVEESNEGNNIAITTDWYLTISGGSTVLLPDLEGVFRKVSSFRDTKVRSEISIINSGNVSTLRKQLIDIEICKRPCFATNDNDDIFIDNIVDQPVGNLKPGNSKTLRFVFDMPAVMAGHMFVAKIDSSDDVEELHEDNNEALSKCFWVIVE